MRRKTITKCLIAVLAVFWIAKDASGGPIEIILNPSPQVSELSCQSYSMALAMAFNPASPFQAETTGELRELERRLRSEIEKSALAHGRAADDAQRDDWLPAVPKVTSQKLKLVSDSFQNVDAAMRFVSAQTGISNPEALGTVIAVALVKTPVLMSFHRIKSSDYRGKSGVGSHIVTILGVQLPQATMGEAARPKLLLVNSAVQYPGKRKNVCWDGDLSDKDKYKAEVTLTDDYELKRFPGIPINWIVKN